MPFWTQVAMNIADPSIFMQQEFPQYHDGVRRLLKTHSSVYVDMTVAECAIREFNFSFLEKFNIKWPTCPHFYKSLQYSIGCTCRASVTSLRKDLYRQQLQRALWLLPKIAKQMGTLFIEDNMAELLWDISCNPDLTEREL